MEISHATGDMQAAARAERSAETSARIVRDDDFAFALVNMLLALSGSKQGCKEISGKPAVVSNLCTLLQVGTQRLQRAILSVLRRAILEQMSPDQATRLLAPYIQAVRAGGVARYLLSLAATPFRLLCRAPGNPPHSTSLPERSGCPASLADGCIGPEISKELLAMLRGAPTEWAQALSSQAATAVCELAALPALGRDVLDQTALWHAVAGLNLLSPEAVRLTALSPLPLTSS